MDYTNLEALEELEWEQEAGEQLNRDAEEVEDNMASAQLTLRARLWGASTPIGSPTSSSYGKQGGRGKEIEEPIVYEEGVNLRGTEEWVRNGQAPEDARSGSSSTTITQRSRGNGKKRARSTPGRREDAREMKAAVKEEMAQLESSMIDLAG